MKKISNKTDFIPPDPTRCQALVPNGYNFMTLGGRPGRDRCTNLSSVIVKEQVPGDDGKCGSMSLCESCLIVFSKQMPNTKVTVQHLISNKNAKV